MCEPGRRCNKPSCPCNEPDTELKDALERMQERFPAPWKCGVEETITNHADYWLAKATLGDVEVGSYGPTPHAAVDAAIKAHDDMVKADALFKVLKAECEASRSRDAAINAGPVNALKYPWEALNIARAATDKAGALR